MKKKRVLLYSMLALAVVLSGCGKSGVESTTKAEGSETISTEPVTLKVYQYSATINDEDFNKYFVEPVKKKYPNITLQLIKSGTGTMPEDLLVSGDFPDLIYTSSNNIGTFKVLGVADDLNPFVKKNNMDMNRFEPVIMDTIKMAGNSDQLYGIPYTQNMGVMLYNKDLFDKFGEKPPTDGMSWNQVISLGRKMTRTENGVQYIGFDPGEISLMGLGLSLPYVDPKTNNSSINNENWQRVYKTFKEAYAVPGFIGPENKYKYGTTGFLKDKNVAMTPVWLSGFLTSLKGKDPVNWDFVSLPNFEEAVGKGREADVHLLMMSNTGKHKEQAFQVMSVITSDDIQMDLSKNGRVSVLSNAEVQKSYGTNIPEFKGKNISGIFKAKPQTLHTPNTDYDKIVRQVIDESSKELALTGVDINTLLRTTEEKATAAIRAKK